MSDWSVLESAANVLRKAFAGKATKRAVATKAVRTRLDGIFEPVRADLDAIADVGESRWPDPEIVVTW